MRDNGEGLRATWRPRAGFWPSGGRRSPGTGPRSPGSDPPAARRGHDRPGLLTGQLPNAQDLSISLQFPGGEHLLGADKLGRDVWARIVYGAQPTLLGAFVVILISGAIGIPLGLVAGYYGGRVDGAIMRVLDALLAFPALLLAILVVATFGRGLFTVVVALGSSTCRRWPGSCGV
jgi:ABC-type dipeptide/oligopeptide/nickel transport system permease subunit